jgi:type III secretion system-like peptide-binding chaperone
MQFKTEAQSKAYDKARDYLHSLFGEVNVKIVGDQFVLQEGSTFVYVRTFAIGENRSGVEVFSYVVIDVDVSLELMRYLLTYNLKLMLGGFGITIGDDDKATVMLTHSILGDSMDRSELYGSVSAIARVADDLDDQIVSNFGGKTALDKLIESKREPLEVWE